MWAEMICYSKSISPYLPLSLLSLYLENKCEKKSKIDKAELNDLIHHNVVSILDQNSQTTTQTGSSIQFVHIKYKPNIPPYFKNLKSKNDTKLFGCKPRVEQTTDMRIKSIKSITMEQTKEMSVQIQNSIKGYLEEKGVPNASIDKYLSKVQTTNASMVTDIKEKIQQSIIQTGSQDQTIDYTDNFGRCDETGKGKVLKQNAVIEMLATSVISSVFKNMVDIKEFTDIEIEMSVQKEPPAYIRNLVFFIDFILPGLIILLIILIIWIINTAVDTTKTYGPCVFAEAAGPAAFAACIAKQKAKKELMKKLKR